MLKTVHVSSPRNKYQQVLSQRDILNTLQQCPKIMKQDKLFLRNKIKQIFKQLQTNNITLQQYNHYNIFSQNQENDIELLQIFTQCNKPLHRIHLYQNHSHLLQVKLRKYIANHRKKYKDQCLNQFKKEKIIEQINRVQIQKRIKQVKDKNMDNRKDKDKKCKYGQRNSEIKSTHSQQKLRPYSPNGLSLLKNKFFHADRNKNLSGNISPHYERTNQIAPQTCSNFRRREDNQNKSSNSNTMSLLKKSNTNGSVSKGKNKSQLHINKQVSKKQEQKYKLNTNNMSNSYRLQVQNLKQSVKFSNLTSSMVMNQNNKFQQFNYPTSSMQSSKFNIFQNSLQKQKLNNNKFNNNQRQDNFNLDNYYVYQNKFDIPFNNSMKSEQISNIKQKSQKNKQSSMQFTSTLTYVQSNAGQDIYTSPELLEECRRFLKNTQQESYMGKSSYEIAKEKQSNLKSSNVFQHIQFPKYQPTSPLSIFQKFTNPKQMVKDIFQRDWYVQISAQNKQQLLQRCPTGYQQIIKSLLSQIKKNTNHINFLQIFPLLRNTLDINFSFSNIFLLLDVDNKGYIIHSDYQTFMQNFKNCPIQQSVFTELKDKIFRFQLVLDQTFKDHEIIPGCFQYLQLIERPQIFALAQILHMFQFQIDSNCNTQGNDID